jgi:hypothetical protein
MRQTSDRVSVVTTKLQASLATAAQLESENHQLTAEIYKIIYEITDTSFVLGKKPPGPDWRSELFSDVQARILQSHCEVLWNVHLNSSHEITTDLCTKLIQQHGELWRAYKRKLRSHAVLIDDLERLVKQLKTSRSVRDSRPLVVTVGLTTNVA